MASNRLLSALCLLALTSSLAACRKVKVASGGSISALDEARVTLVKDQVEGSDGFQPAHIASGGVSGLYMQGWSRTKGYELWRYNDTSGAFSLVEDIYSGLNSSSPAYLTRLGSEILFAAKDAGNDVELWRHLIGTSTTERVADIYDGSVGSYPSQLTAIGSQIYFSASSFDGSSTWLGQEPHVYSNADGVELIEDLYQYIVDPDDDGGPGPDPDPSNNFLVTAGDSSPRGFTEIGSLIYFSARSYTQGYETRTFSGTVSDPVSTIDSGFTAGTLSFEFSKLSSDIDGFHYLVPSDNGSAMDDNGLELWSFDPIAEIFELVEDFVVGPNGLRPTVLGSIGADSLTPDRVVLSGYEGLGDLGLYIYTPSEGLIRRLGDHHFASLGSGTLFDGKLYFAADDREHGVELWAYDPVTDTAEMIIDLNEGSASSSPDSLTLHKTSLYFSADDGSVGRELWVHEPAP